MSPEAKAILDEERRHGQIVRLIAKMPTLAAFAYRHATGLPNAYPDNDLSYAGNFLNMMWKKTELKYHPDSVLAVQLRQVGQRLAPRGQEDLGQLVRVRGSARPTQELMGAQSISS
jgi:citrate synthase